jgi:hypothetical protein
MGMAIVSFAIFAMGLLWCIKYNQDRRVGTKPKTSIAPRPNYQQMISERQRVYGNSGRAKHPTIEDIQKKYPKRKSLEQQRQDAQNLEKQRRLELADRQQLGDSLQKENELLTLVRDHKTCERLLRGLRRQYPNETRLWIVEKAISDIERDRRA